MSRRKKKTYSDYEEYTPTGSSEPFDLSTWTGDSYDSQNPCKEILLSDDTLTEYKKILLNSIYDAWVPMRDMASRYSPFIKVMSEDPLDDRLMLECVGGLRFEAVSKIDGRPIFKITDREAFEKTKPDLEKIGRLEYVSNLED